MRAGEFFVEQARGSDRMDGGGEELDGLERQVRILGDPSLADEAGLCGLGVGEAEGDGEEGEQLEEEEGEVGVAGGEQRAEEVEGAEQAGLGVAVGREGGGEGARQRLDARIGQQVGRHLVDLVGPRRAVVREPAERVGVRLGGALGRIAGVDAEGHTRVSFQSRRLQNRRAHSQFLVVGHGHEHRWRRETGAARSSTISI